MKISKFQKMNEQVARQHVLQHLKYAESCPSLSKEEQIQYKIQILTHFLCQYQRNQIVIQCGYGPYPYEFYPYHPLSIKWNQSVLDRLVIEFQNRDDWGDVQTIRTNHQALLELKKAIDNAKLPQLDITLLEQLSSSLTQAISSKS